MADINVKFVSQKVSKIRFRPPQTIYSQNVEIFATGNWNDEVGKVSLWKIPPGGQNAGGEDDTGTDREPTKLCHIQQKGDVTGLEFINVDAMVSSSSNGSVNLYKYHRQSQSLSRVMEWALIHRDTGETRAACTCVASQGEEMILSAGEDGRINVLNPSHRQPIRTIDKASSCTINGLTFLKQLEILSVDSSGKLNVFDLRQDKDDPVRTFSVSGEQVPLHCVTRHPSQHHVIAAGGQDGVLSIWDLRQDKFPVTLLEAHSAAMWEVKFHPSNPDHLFSCSEDGSVWHWDSSSITGLVTGTGAGSGGGSFLAQHTPAGGASHNAITCPWLGLESARSKMEISTLLPNQTLPVNSLDVIGEMLVCGTDEEAIYTIDLPGIR